jgi:rhodanese-related sulfurtransferase
MDDLRALAQPLILCCASGGRSGQAHHFLRSNELDSCNAGSWLEVNFIKNSIR